MPALSDYVTGTISLTNGSVDFTGTSTGWLLAGFKEGDTIIDITGATEFMGVIATIDANGAGTLTKAWEGPTLVDVAYRMRYQPDGARVSAQARNLIELLGNGNVLALAGLSGSANQVPMFTGPGAMTLVPKTDLVSGVAYDVQVDVLADRDAYDGQAEGFSVLVADVGDGRAAVYAKASATSGDWTDPAYVTGPVGPAPVFTVDATTTLAPGSAATFVLTPTVDGYEIDIGIPAGRADGVPFLWDTGTADSDPGSGDIRANNAALGSATFLYVSKTSAAGSALATYLLSLDDSTNPTKKGDLILKRSADGVSASFLVGTVTDATDYVKIAVSGHSGATSFTAADLIQFEFTRAGDKGADGAGTGDVVGPASAVADRIAVFDGTTGKLIKDGGKTISAIFAMPSGQCRLVKDGSNIKLIPWNGNKLPINGVLYEVPDAGVTLAPTSLGNNNTYNIYAYMNAGVMTLFASVTGHSPSTTGGNKGVEIMTGDDSRTLVGMARTNGSGAWADSDTQRFVLSWFNRRRLALRNGLSGGSVGNSSAPWSEISTAIRVEGLTWAGVVLGDQIVQASHPTANVAFYSRIGLGAVLGTVTTSIGGMYGVSPVGGYPANLSSGGSADLSEGYFFATLQGGRDSGTVTYANGYTKFELFLEG